MLQWTIAILLIVASSCEKVIQTEKPHLSEVHIQEVGQNSVTLTASFYDGNHDFTDTGYCYNKSGAPTIHDNCYSFGCSQEELSATITGLEDATTYYIKAYAKSASGVVFYSEMSAVFTTGYKIEGQSAISRITPYGTSAVIEGIFDYDPSTTVLDMGIIINTEKNPEGTTAQKFPTTAKRDIVDITCEGLSLGTDYYAWSYIETKECGIVYSRENAFSTLAKSLIITPKDHKSDRTLTGIHRTTLDCTIDFSATDGTTIAEAGLIWSTTPDVKYGATGVEKLVDPRITQRGVYTLCATGLTGMSTYYFRSFMRLSTGEIQYSDELTVNTCITKSSMVITGSYADWNVGSATQNRYWEWRNTSDYTTTRQKEDPVWGVEGMKEAFRKEGYSFAYTSDFPERYYWHFTINKQSDTTLMLHFQYNDYPRTTSSGTTHRALFAWKVKTNHATGQIICTDMVYENTNFPTTTESGAYWQKAKLLIEGEYTGPVLRAFFEFLFGTTEKPHPLQLDVHDIQKSDAAYSGSGFILMPVNPQTNSNYDYLRIQGWGTFNNMPLPQWTTSTDN